VIQERNLLLGDGGLKPCVNQKEKGEEDATRRSRAEGGRHFPIYGLNTSIRRGDRRKEKRMSVSSLLREKCIVRLPLERRGRPFGCLNKSA